MTLKVVGHEVEAHKHQKTLAKKYEETASGLASIVRIETTEIIKIEMDAVRHETLKLDFLELEALLLQKIHALRFVEIVNE